MEKCGDTADTYIYISLFRHASVSSTYPCHPLVRDTLQLSDLRVFASSFSPLVVQFFGRFASMTEQSTNYQR